MNSNNELKSLGGWPRNEEFMGRQQASGLLKRFVQKPPPDQIQ